MVCGMHAMIAQTDVVDNAAISVATTDRQMTAELVALYEESRALENTGTAFEIEANRLAIKAAWETIDPAIAALYKPIDTGTLLPETMENLPINGIYYPEEIKEPRSSEGTRDWDTDRLLLDEFVDGVDMDVTGSYMVRETNICSHILQQLQEISKHGDGIQAQVLLMHRWSLEMFQILEWTEIFLRTPMGNACLPSIKKIPLVMRFIQHAAPQAATGSIG